MTPDLETIYESMLLPEPMVVRVVKQSPPISSVEDEDDSEPDSDIVEIMKNILKQASTLDNISIEDVDKKCRSKITRCTNAIRISVTELIEKIQCNL